MSIRILAGNLKGSVLSVPDLARPTLIRFRQSLFDILTGTSSNPSNFFKDKVILDCFAGSGALAIESLSRGAKFAYLVDISQKAISLIHTNTNNLQLSNNCKIFKSDILKIKKAPQVCDIVFLDPPYGKVSINKTIKHLNEQGWINKNSILVTEEDASNCEDLSEITVLITERKYGRSVFKIVKPF